MTYNYKHKLCLFCNTLYKPASSVQKYCDKCRVKANRTKKIVWEKKNREKLNTKSKVWYWKNLANARQSKRRWNNSESGKVYRKKYYLDNKEAVYKSLEKHKEAAYARIKSARKLRRTGIKWICSNCHDSLKKPNVHHVDLNPFNDDLKNLMLLCRDCHSDLHHDLNLRLRQQSPYLPSV